jgi:hypothetical protein
MRDTALWIAIGPPALERYCSTQETIKTAGLFRRISTANRSEPWTSCVLVLADNLNMAKKLSAKVPVETVLTSAAKSIGKTAGKIAKVVGLSLTKSSTVTAQESKAVKPVRKKVKAVAKKTERVVKKAAKPQRKLKKKVVKKIR